MSNDYFVFGLVFGGLIAVARWGLGFLSRKLARQSRPGRPSSGRQALIGTSAAVLGALAIAVPPSRNLAATNAVVSFVGFGAAVFGIVASRGAVGWWLSTTLVAAVVAAYFIGHFLLYFAHKPDAVESFGEFLDLFVAIQLDRMLGPPGIVMLFVACLTVLLSVPTSSRPPAA